MIRFRTNLIGISLVIATLTLTSCNAGGMQNVKHVRQNYKHRVNSGLVQQIHAFSKSAIFYKAYASYFDRADVALPGFKKFFMERSSNCLEKAENMTTIVNERGGHVTFQILRLRSLCNEISKNLDRFPHVCYFVLKPLRQPKKTMIKAKKSSHKPWKKDYKKDLLRNQFEKSITFVMPTALSALEDALALERMLNDYLNSLMNQAIAMQDPAMRVRLDNFLEEQVDTIYNLSNLVTRLGFYDGNDNYSLGEYILDSELIY